MLEVKSAKYLNGYKVWIEFGSGEAGVVDLESEVSVFVYQPLKDLQTFRSFEVSGTPATLVWTNGVSFSPEDLLEDLVWQSLHPNDAALPPNVLAACWLTNNRAPKREDRGYDNPYFWAWETVDGLVHKEPEKAWPVVLELVCQARTDLDLSCVAAGPLEDLLKWHGAAFIARVLRTARKSRRFRECLRGVWTEKDDLPEGGKDALVAVCLLEDHAGSDDIGHALGRPESPEEPAEEGR